LIELKVLMARDKNPLADESAENHSPARNSPVIVVAPSPLV